MKSSPFFGLALESTLVLATVAVGACSSSSTAGAADSGVADVGAPDTAPTGNPFALDSGPAGDTGAPHTHCDDLNDAVTRAAAAASVCDPTAPLSTQCGGTVDGPCCKLTVSIQNTQAVGDYQAAVASYKASCTPNCPVPCGVLPTNGQCAGSGHTGTCE